MCASCFISSNLLSYSCRMLSKATVPDSRRDISVLLLIHKQYLVREQATPRAKMLPAAANTSCLGDVGSMLRDRERARGRSERAQEACDSTLRSSSDSEGYTLYWAKLASKDLLYAVKPSKPRRAGSGPSSSAAAASSAAATAKQGRQGRAS